jgi:integrase
MPLTGCRLRRYLRLCRRWRRRHGASSVGTQRNANNVLRSFRAIVKRAGLNEAEWTPREIGHSFVSLLSDSGVPIENIARLVGHTGGSDVTETLYRQQIRPVLLEGAEVMDRIFAREARGA